MRLYHAISGTVFRLLRKRENHRALLKDQINLVKVMVELNFIFAFILEYERPLLWLFYYV